MRNDIRVKMSELKSRSMIVKGNPNLRHVPNQHDRNVCADNATLLYSSQYHAIEEERRSV